MDPAGRGRSLGAALLGSALELLAELGARDVVRYVDDDATGGDRDRTSADQHHERAGFSEVDRLHSYMLSR